MIFPRFTLRWAFLAMTVFACFSLVLAQAFRGEPWAVALSLTVLAFGGFMLVQASVFVVARVIRGGRSGFADAANPGQSPFATKVPIKQVIVPPQDPDP